MRSGEEVGRDKKKNAFNGCLVKAVKEGINGLLLEEISEEVIG
jgi:hypothetical protein